MESDSHKKLADLIKKHLDNNLSAKDVEELATLLNDAKNKLAFSEHLTGQLNVYDPVQEDDNEVRYNGILGRIRNEIGYKPVSKPGTQIPAVKVSVRKILVWAASMAAVFILAFFIGNRSSFPGYEKNFLARQNQDINIVSTPYGAISKVILPDGTEIILNAGSTIRYMNSYGKINRNVELEGEAFFRVRSNSSHLFTVKAGDITVVAKGTEFNVKAYPDENIIETTLIEGSVEIVSEKGENGNAMKIIDLAPEQKAIFIKNSDLFTLDRIREQDPAAVKVASVEDKSLLISDKTDIVQSTAWTNNELLIRSEKLESLVIKLQRKYNVSFEFGNEEIRSYSFTGLLRDEPLDQVLDAICLSAPISFRIEGKNVILMSR
jgi:ferric-dicitrate binding protein FerR (iron transport regulator)